MPGKHYDRKLTDLEILQLFDDGVYHADLETGIIYSAKTKLPIYTYCEEDQYENKKTPFVRIYGNHGYKAYPVSRIIWIVGTRSAIPPGFEVHHRDTNVLNNPFDNLFALHFVDHRKLHKRVLVEEEPF